MKDFIHMPLVRKLFIVLFGFTAFLCTFALGVTVGAQQSRYANNWSHRYDTMFNMPVDAPQWTAGVRVEALPPTHSVFGRIVSVADPILIIQGRNGIEQQVLLTPGTAVRMGREAIPSQSLQPDVQAAVFGFPRDSGQIEARLIRVFPR